MRIDREKEVDLERCRELIVEMVEVIAEDDYYNGEIFYVLVHMLGILSIDFIQDGMSPKKFWTLVSETGMIQAPEIEKIKKEMDAEDGVSFFVSKAGNA